SERELCCDDAAVAVTGDAQSYARALAEIGAVRHALCQAAIPATGGSLSNRVARLLGVPRPASRVYSPAVVAVAGALSVITAMVVLGQNARLQFEVVSIKLAGSRGTPIIRPLPGRLTANASLRALMQGAYELQPLQIVGGPDWIGSERYEVDA